MYKRTWCVWLGGGGGQRGVVWGGRIVWNNLKGGETEKRWEEGKILKRVVANLGQGVCALKWGAGTHLQTIALKITSRQ